jgi:hypothetical protein
MTAMQPRFSRRSIAITVALASMASLAIGAHAALSERALDAAKEFRQGNFASLVTARLSATY